MRLDRQKSHVSMEIVNGKANYLLLFYYSKPRSSLIIRQKDWQRLPRWMMECDLETWRD